MKKVIKRSGQIVNFDRQKIYNAIHAAAQGEMTEQQINNIEENNENENINEIQHDENQNSDENINKNIEENKENNE